jgi:hypothetical protein
MKIKTAEAARGLGVHPMRLLQHIVELAPDLAFEDVWPEIDDGWVRTLAVREHRSAQQGAKPDTDGERAKEETPDLGLSDAAVRVLDKMARQDRWGGASLHVDTLTNLTHLPNKEVERAVAELRKKGLLDHDGTGRGTVSLNSGKRNEIEAACRNRTRR